MSVITLLTDRKCSDFFLGRIRGDLLRTCPGSDIIEIAHGIPPFDIQIAAIATKTTYKYYPEGTIHLIGVDIEKTKKKRHIIIKAHNHFFITADNGIVNLIFEDHEIESITDVSDFLAGSKPRPALFDFVEYAAELASGSKPETMGESIGDYFVKRFMQPLVEQDFILGSILYFDSYGNAVSNIHKDFFYKVKNGRAFSINFPGLPGTTASIRETYSQVPKGELVVRFNSMDLLEIAINKGDVSQLFGMELSGDIRIEFETPRNDYKNRKNEFQGTIL